MFFVVHHTITDPETAFGRGQNLLGGWCSARRAGQGVLSQPRQGRRLLPLGGNSLEEVRDYVDATMGDSSRQAYFEVDAEIARRLPELASQA